MESKWKCDSNLNMKYDLKYEIYFHLIIIFDGIKWHPNYIQFEIHSNNNVKLVIEAFFQFSFHEREHGKCSTFILH